MLHLTHPVCLPGAEAGTQSGVARLAGWTQKPRGRGTTGRATHRPGASRSQETPVLPAAPVSHVERSETVDFGFCFLLLTEQGQVPAYGHGESKASHSLIEEQQGGCPAPRAQGGNAH